MNNRRKFIKNVLSLAGATAVASTGFGMSKIPETFNSELLNSEEQAFLQKFGTWVNDCTELVKNEKQEARWLKDNQGIMDIAEQAKDWMPNAQKHIDNPEFRKQFLAISNQLTDLIKDNSASKLL